METMLYYVNQRLGVLWGLGYSEDYYLKYLKVTKENLSEKLEERIQEVISGVKLRYILAVVAMSSQAHACKALENLGFKRIIRVLSYHADRSTIEVWMLRNRKAPLYTGPTREFPYCCSVYMTNSFNEDAVNGNDPDYYPTILTMNDPQHEDFVRIKGSKLWYRISPKYKIPEQESAQTT